MRFRNRKVQPIDDKAYVAYKQDKEKTDLDNIRIVQIKDLPIDNMDTIEVMFPYMNNTMPVIKLIDRFYSYIDVRDDLEDDDEVEIED